MGFWTWTDARKDSKTLRRSAFGDYSAADKIRYGSMCFLVCPDDTRILEQAYDGYGLFDGKDAYELVVDWNKQYLMDIFKKLEAARDSSTQERGYKYVKHVAQMFVDDKSSAEIDNYIASAVAAGLIAPYIRKDWKRHIGIIIACGDNNINIPFPLKITTLRRRKYADLYPSVTCQ